MDLDAGSIVWALKLVQGYLWGDKFRIFSDQKALENIGKVRNHNARVQRWLEFFTAFDCTLEYRKGSANGNADFLSRLTDPATEHDRSGSTSLHSTEDGGIYLIRVCVLRTPSSPIPSVGLGGLVPRTESTALGGLLFTSADFCDFLHTRATCKDWRPFCSFGEIRCSCFCLRHQGRSLFRPRPDFACSRHRFRFGFYRTHRGQHGLRTSPG